MRRSGSGEPDDAAIRDGFRKFQEAAEANELGARAVVCQPGSDSPPSKRGLTIPHALLAPLAREQVPVQKVAANVSVLQKPVEVVEIGGCDGTGTAAFRTSCSASSTPTPRLIAARELPNDCVSAAAAPIICAHRRRRNGEVRLRLWTSPNARSAADRWRRNL